MDGDTANSLGELLTLRPEVRLESYRSDYFPAASVAACAPFASPASGSRRLFQLVGTEHGNNNNNNNNSDL